ncbi:glucosaminidase domain-containing protein [Cohnella boryungensis]|uniref:Glucosaminidase domain-containing protein n=1 Tax=Cohnella boryungensis TaxID=768479 RepID=A0ABV8SJ54_9BACL
MESAALLSPTDVITIRRYVHTKYAPLPDGRRAEIVADAIRRALQQKLPNVPEQMQKELVDRLIARCLLGENRDVRTDDVLDMFVEIDLDPSMPEEQLMKAMLQWANEKSPGRWSREQLATRLERGRGELRTLSEAADTVDAGASPAGPWSAGVLRRLRSLAKPLPVLALLAALLTSVLAGVWAFSRSGSQDELKDFQPMVIAPMPEPVPDVGMPAWLQYTEIDVSALKAYLNSRNSMLADEPYFGAILQTAKQYDIHPLFLFAITGQEQGFVPKSRKEAKRIANNPFNVGHSWMEYNTDIHDSVGIASRLLVKLAASRPEGHDPFRWFNKTYAEDPKWSEGVRKIFEKLTLLPGLPE